MKRQPRMVACLTSSWVAVASAMFCHPGAALAQEVPLSTELVVQVDHGRALSEVADQLEKRFGVVVTYEDAPWVAASDIADVTQLVIRANGPGKAAPPGPVLVPRNAVLDFSYPLDPASGRPRDFSALIDAMLASYDAGGNPGQFRVENDGNFYHLIPARVQAPDSKWRDVAPPLSTRIDLPDEERTIDDTLDLVMAQINRSSEFRVTWGWYPLNLFVHTKVRFAANGVPARDVIRGLLRLVPNRMTWRLNFDPMDRFYALSFVGLPGSN